MSKRICTKCKRELDLTMFHRESRRPDGYRCWCKECVNKKMRTPKARNCPSARKTWGQRMMDALRINGNDY